MSCGTAVKGSKGFVLVVVLWVLASLTLVTLGFAHRALLDRRAAAYSVDHVRAMMMARGAVNRGMIELQNKWLKDLVAETPQITHLGQPWARPTNLLKEAGYFSLPPEESQSDIAEFRIVDVESRININAAPEDLLSHIELLSRRTVRNIVKRRTDKGEHDEPPVPFQAVEELRYLEGVEDEDWFGRKGEPGLKDIFTTYGDGKINVNTASKLVLLSLPDVDESTVESILAFRAGADGKIGTGDDRGFKDLGDLVEKARPADNARNSIAQFCKFTSGMFAIQGVATLRAGKVRASVTAVAVANGDNYKVFNWREEALGA